MKRLVLALVALSVFSGTIVFAQPTDTKQEQPKKKKKGGKKKTETKKEETKS